MEPPGPAVLGQNAHHAVQFAFHLRRHVGPRLAEILESAAKKTGGDDDQSIAANNTSAYNDRTVANSDRVSAHAYGVAIDINPVQNPAISHVNGKKVFEPSAGGLYEQRRPLRPGMAEAAVDTFAKSGFRVWGGRWREPLDYQHFHVEPGLTQRLIGLSAANAATVFDAYVRRSTKPNVK